MEELIQYTIAQIMDAAKTYQPTSPLFEEIVQMSVKWLADKIESDMTYKYEDKMYKQAMANTANVLSAVLAGVEVGKTDR